MRRILIFAFVAMLAALGSPASAQVSDADRAAFRQIITGQIDAFGANDADLAFSYATPELQQKFRSSTNFLRSVRRGYSPLFGPRSYYLSTVTIGPDGNPAQRVFIIGSDGLPWLAQYTFARHPHAGWRISVVNMRPFAHPGSGERLVAVLEPSDSDAAFVVSQLRGSGRLEVVQIAGGRRADTDFELWLIEGEAAPVSLGLVGGTGDKTPTVPAGQQAGLPEGATLAVSQEPTGGSTTGAPTGPVVATGAVTA